MSKIHQIRFQSHPGLQTKNQQLFTTHLQEPHFAKVWLLSRMKCAILLA